MKKIILTCLACLLCLCSCSDTETTKVINLSVWHYYGGTAEQTFSYLIQTFNQTVGAENNIVIESYGFDSVPDLSSAVESSASGVSGASSMPNIFAAYADSVLPLYEQGIIANLDDYFTQEDLSVYYEQFLNEGRFGDNGELLILPIAKSTEILHINQTVFDEFASETDHSYFDLKTWESLAKVAEDYYIWSNGEAFFGTDGMANFMIVGTKQLGNDIFVEDNGKLTHQFTEDIAREFWDNFYIPYMKGYYSADAYYRSDDLSSGEIIAYVGSTASSYYFPSQDDNGDITCKTMTYPVFENGDVVVVQQGAGMVVSKSSQEEEEASALFLKWFTEATNNVGFAVSTGYMPVNNNVLNVDYVLGEMSRDGLIEDTLPIVQATKTTYQQLENYYFYTSIPFVGSDDARTILENSLPNKITYDKAILLQRMGSGELKEDIIQDLISGENFISWYENLNEELNNAIN